MKMSSLKLYDLNTKWKRERIKKVLNTLGHKEPEINDTDVMIKKLTEVKLK